MHEIRHYANEVLLADMKSRYPDSEIRFDETSSYPGLHTDPASTVIAYTRSINPIDNIGDNVSFGTEAGLFDGIGVNCLVCGPGSIDQAHKPDEFVSREQMQTCDQMIENLVQRCRETSEFD
jgi:acetylornithine deacetylase